MIVSQQIMNKFKKDEASYNFLMKEVNDTLFNFCSSHGYAYQSRIKTVESLYEKLETGRYKNWEELDDIVAATIIIPNNVHERDVIKFLTSTFQRTALRKKGSTLKPPELFRFDSTRFIGKLKKIIGNERDRKYDLIFEVQVKTALEHAWAVATHSISYKSNVVDWKTVRLTSQLKASVEQLDMIISGFEQISKSIVASKWPDVDFKVEIKALLDSLIDTNKIPIECRPKDISRFCDNIFTVINKLPHFKGKKMKPIINEVKTIIIDEFSKYNAITFPRSITLFQLILIAFNEKFDLNSIDSKYYFLITSEMETFYPSLKKIKKRIVL